MPETHDTRRDHTWPTVLGQDLAKGLLETMLRTDRVPHAMLFHGPVGVGKTSLAWAFAKEMMWAGLPADWRADPARRDRLFDRISRENVHPDVFLLERTGAAGQLLIDTIREFEDQHAWIPAVEGRVRVCLIDDAHAMNPAAANCLLKLLEEPPKHLRFILVTHTPGELLTTIRSRCAGIPFYPVPEDDLARWLLDKVPSLHGSLDAARRLARLAAGSPGVALSQSDRSDPVGPLLAQLEALDRQGFARVFSVASGLADLTKSNTLSEALVLLLACYRDALVFAMSPTSSEPDLVVGEGAREPLARLSQRGGAALLAAGEVIMDEIASGRQLFQRDLHLELLLNRLGTAMKSAPAVATPTRRAG